MLKHVLDEQIVVKRFSYRRMSKNVADIIEFS